MAAQLLFIYKSNFDLSTLPGRISVRPCPLPRPLGILASSTNKVLSCRRFFFCGTWLNLLDVIASA